ncbi:TPA: hypothetical protein EYN98_28440 [Candidatus Poribacteria bacterium]|nr:hypothetical protein [Candidatus Poribacteria bacterium]
MKIHDLVTEIEEHLMEDLEVTIVHNLDKSFGRNQPASRYYIRFSKDMAKLLKGDLASGKSYKGQVYCQITPCNIDTSDGGGIAFKLKFWESMLLEKDTEKLAEYEQAITESNTVAVAQYSNSIGFSFSKVLTWLKKYVERKKIPFDFERLIGNKHAISYKYTTHLNSLVMDHFQTDRIIYLCDKDDVVDDSQKCVILKSWRDGYIP